MIVNQSQGTNVPLLGKQWRSTHIMRSSGAFTIKGDQVKLETYLVNQSETRGVYRDTCKVAAHYFLSIYEMGQISGGN